MANRESIFDRYNMSSGERRLVMSVLVVLVIVLAWMAFDSIDDPATTKREIDKLEKKRDSFTNEINQASAYKARISELEGAGSAVANKEQEVDMLRIVSALSADSGITIERDYPVESTENDFFIEKSLRIRYSGKEDQIVNFLRLVGEKTNSLVRVSDMDLGPDRNKTKLQGIMKLTSSYQKNYIGPPPATTPAKPSSIPEPATKPSEPAKPAIEPVVAAKEEPESKPEAKPTPEPASTKRRIPTRRVRTSQ